MPRTVTAPIILTDLTLERVTFAYEGSPAVLKAIVSYKLITDTGAVHEIKHQGNYAIPPTIQVAITSWLPAIVTERKIEEGI